MPIETQIAAEAAGKFTDGVFGIANSMWNDHRQIKQQRKLNVH